MPAVFTTVSASPPSPRTRIRPIESSRPSGSTSSVSNSARKYSYLSALSARKSSRPAWPRYAPVTAERIGTKATSGSTSRTIASRSTRLSASTACLKISTGSSTASVSPRARRRCPRELEVGALDVIPELVRVAQEQSVGGRDEAHAPARHANKQLAPVVDSIDRRLVGTDELRHLRERHPCGQRR